ncbi:MAG: polyprenyl synthetase family protein [Candidatus Sungbacteria bacterium]|nr:polyprenyl synthetase family protein [Candidatus Sungbacteria bacterium]
MAKIDFIRELDKLKTPVWRVIQNYLPDKVPPGHYDMVREYPGRQGKYFRPGLVVLGTQLFGGDPRKAALTAAAMQTSEDWLLIHDDIEDHSEQRRHKPTLNRLHGDELAINAGDALHIIMWKMLGENARLLHNEIGWKIFNKMSEVLLTATEGQYLELQWIREKKVFVSQDEYLDMVKRKTAFYTVIGPLQLGAILAGATDREIRQIEDWGTPFGYAFQIWDDCMNISTPSEKQGKETGGDILEGKRTLILSHLLAHCNQKERRHIQDIYLKPRARKTKRDKDYVLRLMATYGSIDHAKKIALEFGNRSKEIFDRRTAHLKNTKAKETIRAGIDFVTNREQ